MLKNKLIYLYTCILWIKLYFWKSFSEITLYSIKSIFTFSLPDEHNREWIEMWKRIFIFISPLFLFNPPVFRSVCTIGPTFCAVKKEVRKKEILKLEGKGRKYSSSFYSAMITATRKVHFLYRPSSPFLLVVRECGWDLAVWHTPVIADRS